MWAALLSWIPSIVIKVMGALGIGFAVYKGYDVLLNSLIDYVKGSWVGLPSDIASILALAGFNEAISIILSAITIRMGIDFVGKLVTIQK